MREAQNRSIITVKRASDNRRSSSDVVFRDEVDRDHLGVITAFYVAADAKILSKIVKHSF